MGEVVCDIAHIPRHCNTNRKDRTLNDEDIGGWEVNEGGHHSTSKEDQGAAHGIHAAGPMVGPHGSIPSFALHPSAVTPSHHSTMSRDCSSWRSTLPMFLDLLPTITLK